ncbi:MAG: hypothetical protein AAF829_02635 [Pseudomonadota bacterium]
MGELFSDWRFWVGAVAAITLMYIARPYLHRLLRGTFFGTAYFLNRLANWVALASQRVYEEYAKKVAAHLTEEYDDRMRLHELKLERRARREDEHLMKAIDALEVSTQRFEGATDVLTDININKETEQAVRRTFQQERSDSPAKTSKAVAEVKRVVTGQIQAVRPEITGIKKEIKPLGENISRLRETARDFSRHAEQINKDFEAYEASVYEDDRKKIAQQQSILIPWLMSLVVMLIALGGVFLNFFLIERPMAEIVGNDLQIAGLPLPRVAAFVVILLEAVAGIFFVEAAGLTSLGWLDRVGTRGKRIMMAVAGAFLLAFSLFEAFLALQRESLIALDQMTQALASGEEVIEEEGEGGVNLTMISQMMLGFMIPWLLAVAAIPLEIFVRNLVFLLRLMVHQILMMASYFLRALSTALKTAGLFLLRLYDLIIFLPLAIENMVMSLRKSQTPKRTV